MKLRFYCILLLIVLSPLDHFAHAQSTRHVFATSAALVKSGDTSYSPIFGNDPFQFESGKKYHIRWKGKAGYGDEDGGMKLRLNGTATISALMLTVDGRQMMGAPGFGLPFAATWVSTTLTSNEISNANPGNYNSLIEIEGVVTVSGTGSILLEMAQAQSSTYASTLKWGFLLEVEEID